MAKRTLPGSLLVVTLLSGCRPVIGKYQVKKFRARRCSSHLLIELSANREITTRLSIPTAADHSQHTDCSAAVGHFSLSRVKNSFSEWTAKLPSLQHWQEGVAVGVSIRILRVSAIRSGSWRSRGCFDKSARVLLDQSGEIIPVRIHDTYYYRYDYRLGTGFIDLVPGMQLKIERAEFDPSGKFQGHIPSIMKSCVIHIGPSAEQKTEKVTDESAADRELAAHQTGMFFERAYFSWASKFHQT